MPLPFSPLSALSLCGLEEVRLTPSSLPSFYSQLYLASSDKHVVHHLTIQLELLPNWTILACQRVGDPGGPLTSEFELTEEELDW